MTRRWIEWTEFPAGAMSLAGPYTLAVKQEPQGFRWWLSAAPGLSMIEQGRAESMAEGKAAVQAVFADVTERLARRRPPPSPQ